MGYSLEFYSLAWDSLRIELSQPRRGILDDARRVKGIGPFHSRSAESALQWRAAIAGVSRALNSGGLDEFELVGDKALAFAVMVRYLGSSLGTLDHASASGKEFRYEFLDRIAGQCFQDPMLGTRLTERAFYGLISLEYPSWGGLTREEVRRIVESFRPTAIEARYQVWLDELRDILDAASERDSDVMTLYM